MYIYVHMLHGTGLGAISAPNPPCFDLFLWLSKWKVEINDTCFPSFFFLFFFVVVAVIVAVVVAILQPVCSFNCLDLQKPLILKNRHSGCWLLKQLDVSTSLVLGKMWLTVNSRFDSHHFQS